MPEDLKNYRADEDAFALFTPQEAGAIFAAILGALMLLDRLGAFA